MHGTSTSAPRKRQVLSHNPFLRPDNEAGVLSTQIGIGRARKAIASVVELWDTSPPHDRHWDRVFRAWLAELERADR